MYVIDKYVVKKVELGGPGDQILLEIGLVITISSINYLASCNSYCNQQSLIILYVSHPAITYLVYVMA